MWVLSYSGHWWCGRNTALSISRRFSRASAPRPHLINWLLTRWSYLCPAYSYCHFVAGVSSSGSAAYPCFPDHKLNQLFSSINLTVLRNNLYLPLTIWCLVTRKLTFDAWRLTTKTPYVLRRYWPVAIRICLFCVLGMIRQASSCSICFQSFEIRLSRSRLWRILETKRTDAARINQYELICGDAKIFFSTYSRLGSFLRRTAFGGNSLIEEFGKSHLLNPVFLSRPSQKYRGQGEDLNEWMNLFQ